MRQLTIWKFPLSQGGVHDMPRGARILSVQPQAGELQLWALVDPAAPREPRRFGAFGTGQELPPQLAECSFVVTVQSGPAVWHIFEIPAALAQQAAPCPAN
jgi:hypothetical protein